MKCFYCNKQACAKVGIAVGNIWMALIGGKSWSKAEHYLCRNCYDKVRRGEITGEKS